MWLMIQFSLETCGQLGEKSVTLRGQESAGASEGISVTGEKLLSFRITTPGQGHPGVSWNFSNGEPSP